MDNKRAGGADGAIPTVPRLAGVEVDGRVYEVRLEVTAPPWAALARARRERGAAGGGGAADGAVTSPMQGTVLDGRGRRGRRGDHTGQLLCVVEAMKMENEIVAPRVGTVRDLSVAPGAAIASGQLLRRVVSDA